MFARPLVEGAQSRFQLITELARRDHLTVRQLIGRLGGGRGHRTFAGTPEQVADTIVEWAEAGAADGFNVMPPVLPSGLEAFTEHVIPLLRKRGVFRTEYTGRTLREHYGIPRPESQFTAAAGWPGPGVIPACSSAPWLAVGDRSDAATRLNNGSPGGGAPANLHPCQSTSRDSQPCSATWASRAR